ncbi:Cytochrome P450 2E1 [Bulinus truncatus]|nr:Cytochrome P450 2E1 [Bulinus truncatus]
MDFAVEGLLLSVPALLVIIYWYTRPDSRDPPSPMRPLPFVGHLLHLKSDVRASMKKYWAKSGDIYSLYIGNKLLVVLNGYDLIKETIVKRAEDFNATPVLYFDKLMNYHNNGVLSSRGEVWKEHRWFIQNILRKFGLGKDIFAQRVQTEVNYYLDQLASYKGQSTNIKSITNKSAANVISSIIIGQRFEYEDPIFQKLITEIEEFCASSQQSGIFNVFSFLQYLPGDILKIKTTVQHYHELYALCRHFIDANKDKDPEEYFIASYMAERETKIKNGEKTTMDDINLLKCVFEMLGAGTETTSTTICWFVLYMLNHPDAQKKIYDEICQHVGTDRTLTLQDKPSLIYLSATIMEVQRLASIIPQSGLRACTKTVTIRGYTFPIGTLVAPNLDSVLFDEKIWGPDASRFRPERFIDKEGKLTNPEEFMPFGTGRRVCPGESMAKTELFLCLGSMIQRFQLLPEDPLKPPPLNYTSGLTVAPEAFMVRLVERQVKS